MSEPPEGPDDPRPGPESAVRARVAAPALFLLTISVLNLLGGIYVMVRAISVKKGDMDAQWNQQWDDMPAEQRDFWQKEGWTGHDLLVAMSNFLLGWGGVSALVSVCTVVGARRMLSLRSYGLAMTAAVVTALPCVTPCCFAGQVAGIWAVIVLLNPSVRAAFH